jgi:hypothetical protein
MQKRFFNMDGTKDLYHMSYVPIPCISYTCYYFLVSKHAILSNHLSHNHVWSVYIFKKPTSRLCLCLYSHKVNSLFPTEAYSFKISQTMCHFCISFWHISHRLREIKFVEALHYNIRDTWFDFQQGPWKFYSALFILSAFSSPKVYSA